MRVYEAKLVYQPQPLRRVFIPKSNGKLRPLGIPTIKDRAMQALYLLALEPIAETTGDPNSYGFRRARSTADAIQHCFCVLSHVDDSATWVLEGDIKGCFDNISHEWMLENIPTDTEVLRKWLRAGFVDKRTWFATEAGTPQGGIISPTLANLTLDGLERVLKQRFRAQSGHGAHATRQRYNPKVHLIRYADDFIITGCSRELLTDEVLPVVERFLNERGLQLSPEKTKVTHIREGFDFLGQNLRKHRERLLVVPAKKNVHAFLEKVRTILSNNVGSEQAPLIRHLSLVIKGWANYHRYIAASRVFATVDTRVFEALWFWAQRRHPNKTPGWIAKRYWRPIGRRFWEFAAVDRHSGTGRRLTLTLARAAEVRIRRHIKVCSDANPFDPEWRDYFAVRARRGERGRPAAGSKKTQL